MPISFPDLIRPRSNLTYKKRERKRALTEREVADVKEVQKARVRRKISIERDKIAKHQQIMHSREDENQNENLDDVIITSFRDSIVFSSSSSSSFISSSEFLPEMQILFEFSQQSIESQIASKSLITTTRSKREVMRSKSKVQKRLNSQRRYETEVKTNNKTKREQAAAKKTAKTMKIRKKDVSQLIDSDSDDSGSENSL
jgi:hypothetical protein